MKQVKILFFISALALFFVQCSVRPSERSHDNAIGIWFGCDGESGWGVNGNWILGVDLKHLNSKNTIWDLNTGTNTVWNFKSGFLFGKPEDLKGKTDKDDIVRFFYHLYLF